MDLGVMSHSVYGGTGYEHIRVLGTGSFGQVWLAQHIPTGEMVAIKCTSRKKEPKLLEYLEAEILNQRVLRHPHVVEFKEVFLVDENTVGIAMEYCSGGNLFSLVQKDKRLKEAKARWFFQQLCMALDFCHCRQVAHRDIKLENLMLCPIVDSAVPLLKMADFGFSKVFLQGETDPSRRTCMASHVGTLAYMAPEVILTSLYDGFRSDVWSCGVVLYIMLVGTYPFGIPGAVPHTAYMQQVATAEWSVPTSLALSPACMDLLKKILVADPHDRLSMDAVMKHAWFLDDLPAGTLEYNTFLLTQPPEEEDESMQTVGSIKAVLAPSVKHLTRG